MAHGSHAWLHARSAGLRSSHAPRGRQPAPGRTPLPPAILRGRAKHPAPSAFCSSRKSHRHGQETCLDFKRPPRAPPGLDRSARRAAGPAARTPRPGDGLSGRAPSHGAPRAHRFRQGSRALREVSAARAVTTSLSRGSRDAPLPKHVSRLDPAGPGAPAPAADSLAPRCRGQVAPPSRSAAAPAPARPEPRAPRLRRSFPTRDGNTRFGPAARLLFEDPNSPRDRSASLRLYGGHCGRRTPAGWPGGPVLLRHHPGRSSALRSPRPPCPRRPGTARAIQAGSRGAALGDRMATPSTRCHSRFPSTAGLFSAPRTEHPSPDRAHWRATPSRALLDPLRPLQRPARKPRSGRVRPLTRDRRADTPAAGAGSPAEARACVSARMRAHARDGARLPATVSRQLSACAARRSADRGRRYCSPREVLLAEAPARLRSSWTRAFLFSLCIELV